MDKVKYADGTIDYMTVMTMHDNDISNLKVGNKIKQGTIYYQEGTKGYTTGNHIHLAVGKGKFSGSGWYENEYGYRPINNQYDVHKALYLFDSVNIINSGGYNWIKTNALTEVDNLNKDDSIDTMIHVVKGGENLTKISKMYSTTINEIVKLNNIINKNLIYVGQKLIVPNNKTTYLKKYTGNSLSLVDSLKNVGIDSSFNYRTRIASANGIVNYIGTSIQNTYLLNLLKQGKLIRP